MTRLALLELMSWACENDPEVQCRFAEHYELFIHDRLNNSLITRGEMVDLIKSFENK